MLFQFYCFNKLSFNVQVCILSATISKKGETCCYWCVHKRFINLTRVCFVMRQKPLSRRCFWNRTHFSTNLSSNHGALEFNDRPIVALPLKTTFTFKDTTSSSSSPLCHHITYIIESSFIRFSILFPAINSYTYTCIMYMRWWSNKTQLIHTDSPYNDEFLCHSIGRWQVSG
jgi:hypothetical protein